jgi:hypothetical protein
LALHYQVFATEGEGKTWLAGRKSYGKYSMITTSSCLKNRETKTTRCGIVFGADGQKKDENNDRKGRPGSHSFNPEIEPEQQYSEKDWLRLESMKYLPLHMWSRYRFGVTKTTKYPQYENDHTLAITEVKKVIEGLKDNKSEDKSFTLFTIRSLHMFVLCS